MGWVGRTIWQVHGGTPVVYDVIGFARRLDVPAAWPARVSLHVLQDASLPEELRWDAAAPSFLSEEAALKQTVTREDRARLEEIERKAFARRGFGDYAPGLRPRREPVEVDLFTFAAEELALRTGRPVSQERTRLLYPNACGSEAPPLPLWQQDG